MFLQKLVDGIFVQPFVLLNKGIDLGIQGASVGLNSLPKVAEKGLDAYVAGISAIPDGIVGAVKGTDALIGGTIQAANAAVNLAVDAIKVTPDAIAGTVVAVDRTLGCVAQEVQRLAHPPHDSDWNLHPGGPPT